MIRKVKKVFLLLSVTLALILSLTGCGDDGPVLSEEDIRKGEIYNLTLNPYIDSIKESRIVSPQAVINAFNEDIEESLKAYDKQKLAIEITVNDIKNGKLFLGDNTPIEGYYCHFEEGFEDEKSRITKTSLVISIHKGDGYLVDYGYPTSLTIVGPDGNLMTRNGVPIVTKYFLVGNISKIVGDISDKDERINILISDARLVPATTYQEIKVPQELVKDGGNVLDTNSGESINQQIYQYNFGKFDFNEDGKCDNLLVQVDEFHTSSSLDKLVNSKILGKIKTPLNTYVQILYNNDNSTSKAFSLNFPLQLKTLTAGECTSFIGEYVNYAKLNVGSGDVKIDTSNYELNVDDVIEAFPIVMDEIFYLCPKDVYYGIDEEGGKEIVVNLLDGTKDSLSNPKRIWLKNSKVMMSGEIGGDIFIYTKYPFEMIYKPSFYFYSDGLVKEKELDYYEFLDANAFSNNEGKFNLKGNEIKNYASTKDYKYVSTKNIYISTQKVILENVEVTSKLGSAIEKGIGYYYEENNGERTLKETTIFYTGSQKFALCSLSRDEKDSSLYWLEVLSDSGNRGYIPVKMNGPWTAEKTIYAYYDNVNAKNYYLFDTNGNQGILSRITE